MDTIAFRIKAVAGGICQYAERGRGILFFLRAAASRQEFAMAEVELTHVIS